MARRRTAVLPLALVLAAAPAPLAAQAKGGSPPAAIDSAQFGGLEWRSIGPWRGGRATTATGVRGQPLVYYMGATGGGGTGEGRREWCGPNGDHARPGPWVCATGNTRIASATMPWAVRRHWA